MTGTFALGHARVRRPKVSRLRVQFIALLTLITVLLFLLAVEAAIFWPATLARIAFPWAVNEWADSVHMMQLFRMEQGGPGYAPPYETNSFDYGPVYLFALFYLRRLFGLPFSVVSYRTISMFIGLVSVIPFCACAVLIARSLGLRRLRSIPTLVVVCSTVLLTVAVLSRDITFDTLHPDTLLALLVATLLALYYAIAQRALGPRAIWALVVVCAVTVFTKQNSFIAFPILAASLAWTRTISWRLALVSTLVFGAIVLASLAVMPGDMRAWTFGVPGSHPYEFTMRNRVILFWQFFTYWESYLAFELIAFVFVLALLVRREGRNAYITHGAAAASVIVLALTAYFKMFGVWNNLSIIGLFCVPYCATLVGLLTTPRFLRSTHWTVAALSIALLLLVGHSLHDATRRATPDAEILGNMSAASQVLHELCARGPILMTMYPDMLFDCPNASFSLFLSYGELFAARGKFNLGLTVFDRPTSYPYVVDIVGWALPRRWQRTYHVVRKVPVVFGFGNYYYPVNMRIWARDEAPPARERKTP